MCFENQGNVTSSGKASKEAFCEGLKDYTTFTAGKALLLLHQKKKEKKTLARLEICSVPPNTQARMLVKKALHSAERNMPNKSSAASSASAIPPIPDSLRKKKERRAEGTLYCREADGEYGGRFQLNWQRLIPIRRRKDPISNKPAREKGGGNNFLSAVPTVRGT